MTRRDGHAINGTVGDVFDLGDVLYVVVGVADTHEDPETEGQGDEEQGPGNDEFFQISGL